MTCSIWINEDDYKQVLKDLVDFNPETYEPLYEGHEIDELYIENDGELYGMITVGPVNVSINIPFEEWFGQFSKFESFVEMEKQFSLRVEKHKKAIKELADLLNNSLSETKIEEGSK